MKIGFAQGLELVGLAALAFGAFLIWPPAAAIVGGLGMIVWAQGIGE